MARVRLPQTKFISKVTLLIGRVLIEATGGKERSFRYEHLTAAQESTLRSMSDPIPKQRQSIKSAPRDSGRRHNRGYNAAADVASRCVLVSAGNGKEDRLAVVEVVL